MVGALIERVERDGIVNLTLEDIASPLLPRIWSAYGITAALWVPLRRGDELVGIHTAGYRGRCEGFDHIQQRIARGIGQLGSLALQSARLFEELERANRLKSEFVATMSHELRTPLNIIIGYNELVLEEAFGPLSAEQSEVLQRVQLSARNLLELISATLDMSRLESGQMRVQLSEVNVPELLQGLAAEVRKLHAPRPEVLLTWQALPPEMPVIRTDELKLSIALKNLITNALKFTTAGEVVVSTALDGERLTFSVRDSGPGINAQQREEIFEPFRQGDGSSTRVYGGVGLGLYVTRRLVEMLGGSITVESTVGQGSTFHLTVPAVGCAP